MTYSKWCPKRERERERERGGGGQKVKKKTTNLKKERKSSIYINN